MNVNKMMFMENIGNINRGGQNYACPSLIVMEIAAESGFASSDEKVDGIMTGKYDDEDGVVF